MRVNKRSGISYQNKGDRCKRTLKFKEFQNRFDVEWISTLHWQISIEQS